VTIIGDQAFYGASSLTSLTIGNGVTSIGKIVFNGASSLVSFTVDVANAKYSSDAQGVLYNKEKTVLIQVPLAKSTIIIPDTVVMILDDAFTGAKSLTTLIIPKTVTFPGAELIAAVAAADKKRAADEERAAADKKSAAVDKKYWAAVDKRIAAADKAWAAGAKARAADKVVDKKSNAYKTMFNVGKNFARVSMASDTAKSQCNSARVSGIIRANGNPQYLGVQARMLQSYLATASGFRGCLDGFGY
jgi:hypothetical protein